MKDTYCNKCKSHNFFIDEVDLELKKFKFHCSMCDASYEAEYSRKIENNLLDVMKRRNPITIQGK